MDYVRGFVSRSLHVEFVVFRCSSLGAHGSEFEESSVVHWAVSNVAKVDVEFSSDLIGSRESWRHPNTSFVSSDLCEVSGS